MDFNRKKIRLGDLLVETGNITQEQLERALKKQKERNKKLGEILVDEGILTEDDIAAALSRQLNIEIVDLQNINIDKGVTKLVQRFFDAHILSRLFLTSIFPVKCFGC